MAAKFGLVSSKNMIKSAFKGMDVIKIPKTGTIPINEAMERYNITLRRIINNIKSLPFNITNELAQRHDRKTGEILQEADLRDEARTALIATIDLKDNNSEKLEIVSWGDIGAFFEFGVSLHSVYASDSTVRGDLVGDWMDDHGFPPGSQGFLVGKPGTILDKSNPLMFMGKGFDEAWKNASSTTNKFINKI